MLNSAFSQQSFAKSLSANLRWRLKTSVRTALVLLLALLCTFIGTTATYAQSCVSEDEPNDRFREATVAGAVRCFSGTLAPEDQNDFFQIQLDAAAAATLYDLQVETTVDPATEPVMLITIYDSEGREMQRRDGPALPVELAFTPGFSYTLRIDNRATDAYDYTMQLVPSRQPPADFAVEPNDQQADAARIGEAGAIRGRATGREEDFLVFTVTGEPQLWRLQAVGENIQRLTLMNAAGQMVQQSSAEDGRRVRMENLYLLPGDHWLSILGTDSDYAIRVVPLGPPLDASEIEVPVGTNASDATAEPTTTSSETVAVDDPPLVAVSEREPNDDESRAHRLTPGRAERGQISSHDDRDRYRFYLGGDSYVRISLAAPTDGDVELDLDGYFSNMKVVAGTTATRDLLLPPGDHFLALDSNNLGYQAYTLQIDLLDPFALPADLEPVNNALAGAQPLPATLVVTGTGGMAGDRNDWYQLPTLQGATQVSVTAVSARADVRFYRDGERLPVTHNRETATFSVTLAADTVTDVSDPAATAIYVTADGPYTLTLVADPPLAAQTAPEPLPVTLAWLPTAQPLAAFYEMAQEQQVTLRITNEDSQTHDLTLRLHSSELAWTPRLAEAAITLEAGASTEIDVPLDVLADVPASRPVYLAAEVENAAGQQRVAQTELAARCGAEPVNPNRNWTTAGALFGGLNVAALALGAETDVAAFTYAPELFDGRVSYGAGLQVAIPSTVTVDLAGDEPIGITGVLLNPQSDSRVQRYLRKFSIRASLDNEQYTTVFQGQLSPLPREQAFAFAEAVQARFIQIVFAGAGLDEDTASLGELKVIADPLEQPLGERRFDLADPALGGHVVTSSPLLGKPRSLLDPTLNSDIARVPITGTVEWVIGFHHNRAAQISTLQWLNNRNASAEEQLQQVEVAVSTVSPSGPWQPVSTWQLDPTSTNTETLTLDQPVWARFVRFVGRTGGESQRAAYPQNIAILERASADEYRTILAEYGHYRQAAIYELLRDVHPFVTPRGEATENESRDSAQPLADGETVRGTATVGEDEDWYRIDVPASANQLTLTIAGDPTVAVAHELVDEAGEAVPHTLLQENNLQQISASVAPGAYYLRIYEPPRSVAFVWDNSGSVSPYIETTYQALNRFASQIDPRHEAINLQVFSDQPSFLLEEWSGDRNVVLQTLTNYDREDGSSDAELNLRFATQELGERLGTRAVVILTDAESPGYRETSELWQALNGVQPRVFTLEISSRGSDYAQDLMQDWASVNNGYYSYLSSIGELELGFERAECHLRRPVVYQVSAALTFVDPPTPTPTPSPTPTSTPTPTPTATATATPTSTPTPTATATPTLTPIPTATPTATPTPTITPTPTPAGPGTIAVSVLSGPAPIAGDTAIELILDASGSMLQLLGGERRIDVARAVLVDLTNNLLQPGTPLALRVFGHIEPDACRTDLEIPLQPLDPAAVTARLNAITAMNLARTPIADSLRLVAEDLAGTVGEKIIVLVTDGEETCDGDPAAAIRFLQEQGFDVRVNIVGFAIDDAALQAQFEAWATLGGGAYFNATNAEELRTALRDALRAPFRVLAADGTVVATGTVGDAAVTVPAGRYTVEVLTAPIQRFDAVEVGGEAEVTIMVTQE